ncbi:MAG TPA: hypothetical protein VJ144_10875 [Candidatus Polarisedimenticolia bacterium]|nr:hypothetical protein [Candidatus Polarisedimenticolia bacterium]
MRRTVTGLFALLLGVLAPASPRAAELDEAASTLKQLVSLPGVAGYEGAVRAAIRSALPSWASPEEDTLGNLTVTIGSGAPQRLLIAHMDEPGYVVSAITDGGYLKVQRLSRTPLPALFDQFILGQPVVIGGRHGVVPGVTVIYSTHLWRGEGAPLKAPVEPEDLFVDVGARSPEEVRAAGVRLLDPLTIARRVVDLAGDKVAGPAMDDRAGCAALVLLLRRLEPVKVRGTVTIAFSAQEVMGARGAARLARRLHPDTVLVIDPPALPDAGPRAAPGRRTPGDGPVVGMPGGPVAQPLYDRIAALAARDGVSIQTSTYSDLGDGEPFANRVPLLLIGVPVLHPATPAEIADIHDLQALARLLASFVEEGA